MNTFDTRAWLAAVLGHINRHPHLDHSISSVSGYYPQILVGGPLDKHLAHFAAWLRSMPEVQPVRVTGLPTSDRQPYTHLHATGYLADGTTECEVVVCLHDTDSDLLAANTVVEVDALIPVELLLRLASTGQVAQ